MYIQPGDYSQHYCVAYVKVAKKVDLKSSYHKGEKFVTMCGDGGELDLLLWSFCNIYKY